MDDRSLKCDSLILFRPRNDKEFEAVLGTNTISEVITESKNLNEKKSENLEGTEKLEEKIKKMEKLEKSKNIFFKKIRKTTQNIDESPSPEKVGCCLFLFNVQSKP